MSSVISLEEAAQRTGLTKRQIGDKVAEGKLRIERDPVTGERGIYPHTLRGVNGYQPPEPPPPPRAAPPPPPKPEPWTPSHSEMAALIKLGERERAIRVAELVRQHPHLRDWFPKNLPPVFRRQEPPPPPEAKPAPPPPPRPQAWQTSWQGQATWQQYHTPPKPEPPPVRPAPPEPPKRQQPPPPPYRPPPPPPPETRPRPRAHPSMELSELWRLLGSALVALISAPFVRLRYWMEDHELTREFARLWENRLGRWIVIVVGVYILWRVL